MVNSKFLLLISISFSYAMFAAEINSEEVKKVASNMTEADQSKDKAVSEDEVKIFEEQSALKNAILSKDFKATKTLIIKCNFRTLTIGDNNGNRIIDYAKESKDKEIISLISNLYKLVELKHSKYTPQALIADYQHHLSLASRYVRRRTLREPEPEIRLIWKSIIFPKS